MSPFNTKQTAAETEESKHKQWASWSFFVKYLCVGANAAVRSPRTRCSRTRATTSLLAATANYAGILRYSWNTIVMDALKLIGQTKRKCSCPEPPCTMQQSTENNFSVGSDRNLCSNPSPELKYFLAETNRRMIKVDEQNQKVVFEKKQLWLFELSEC